MEMILHAGTNKMTQKTIAIALTIFTNGIFILSQLSVVMELAIAHSSSTALYAIIPYLI